MLLMNAGFVLPARTQSDHASGRGGRNAPAGQL